MSLRLDIARAERNLQNNRAGAIQRARDGSLPDIYAVVHALENLPELCTAEVVTMFSSHLDASKIPDPRIPLFLGSPAMEMTRRAMASLLGIKAFAMVTHTLSVVNGWPDIFEWMTFLAGTHGRTYVDDLSGAMDTVMEFLNGVLIILPENVIDVLPDIIPLAASLWMKEDKADRHHPHPPTTGSILMLLDKVDSHMLVDAVILNAGGKTNSVADIALSRLRSALSEQAPRPTYVFMYIDLISGFTRVNNDSLRRALLRKGSITLVVDAMFKMSKALAITPYPHGVDTGDVRRPAVLSCFRFFEHVTKGRDGIVSIRVAIQEGLLRALYDVGLFFDQFNEDGQNVISRLIADIIPSFLVYGSVVAVFHAALAKFQNKAKMHLSHPKDAWTLLMKRYTLGRVVALRNERQGDLEFCCNKACMKLAFKQNFKRCARCRVVWYCSKECQTAAWNAHKPTCALVESRNQNLKTDDFIKQQDARFFAEIVKYETQQAASHLRTLAASFYPSTPLFELGVRANYTTIPPTFSVFLLNNHDSLHDYAADGLPVGAITDGMIEEMREMGRSVTLIQVISRTATGSQSKLTIVPLRWNLELQRLEEVTVPSDVPFKVY